MGKPPPMALRLPTAVRLHEARQRGVRSATASVLNLAGSRARSRPLPPPSKIRGRWLSCRGSLPLRPLLGRFDREVLELPRRVAQRARQRGYLRFAPAQPVLLEVPVHQLEIVDHPARQVLKGLLLPCIQIV